MAYFPGIGENIAGVFDAIGNARDSWREREQQRAFTEAARSARRPDGSFDYNKLAGTLMEMGDVRGAMSLAEMGFKDAERQDERKWRQGVTDMFSGGGSGSGSPARPTGSVNQRGGAAMRYLTTQAGLSPAQAAGVVGNLVQESRLDPNAVGDNGTAFGIAQWRGERLNRLQRFAASQGKDWRDFETQLAFIPVELQSHETAAWQKLQQARTPQEAAAAFIGYERPRGWTANNPTAGHGWDNRVGHALAFADQGSGESGGLNGGADPRPVLTQPPVQMADASGQVPIPRQPAEPWQARQPSAATTDPATAFAPGDQGQQDIRTFVQSLPRVHQQVLQQVATRDPEKALAMVADLYQKGQGSEVDQDIQEYEQALQRGYFNGSYLDFINAKAGRPETDYGTPEKGTVWARDADGRPKLDERGAPIAVPYKGGSVYAEQQAAEQKAGQREEAADLAGSVVLTNIDRIRDKVKNAPWYSPTTGFFGDWLKGVSGSRAADVKGLAQTIRANVGFDKLQKMRDASPTGGALGPVSDAENALLQSTLVNLEQSQSEEQFLENLDMLEYIYTAVMKKAAAYPNAEEFGFGGGTLLDQAKDRLGKQLRGMQSGTTSGGVKWRIEP